MNPTQFNPMTGHVLRLTLLATLLALPACSTTPKPDGEVAMTAAFQEGVPGGVIVGTYQTTATVTAIDAASHKATLQFPDDKSKTFVVRPDVDLRKAKLGEEVVIHTTEAMAIVVEKP